MQQEMMYLKEEVLASQPIPAPMIVHEPTVDIAAIEDVWRCKVEEVAADRQILLEKDQLW